MKQGKGPVPGPEDFVKVNYRGTFIDGSEFDSSYSKGEPARVQTDGVIKGWTEALKMMKTGSERGSCSSRRSLPTEGAGWAADPAEQGAGLRHGTAIGGKGRQGECTTGCAGRPDTEAERDR